MMEPQIKWIKNDPEKHKFFVDGSTFLVALQVSTKSAPPEWDFDVVTTDCDGESMHLRVRDNGDAYYSWTWDDFEYFHLLGGDMPTPEPEDDR